MKINELSKVTVILRGYNYETVRNICLAINRTKHIRNVEVTMNTPDALNIISTISKEFGECLNIGAGTVTSLEQAEQAIIAGAKFLLSPTVMEKDIVDYASEKNVLTVCGAFSPTEILEAIENNCDAIKIFPASATSESYFNDIKAPLGNFKIMAVGGVNKLNAKEYFDRGANYIGLGGLFSKDSLKENNLEKMVKDCEEFENLIFNE